MHSISNYKFKSLVGFLQKKFINSSLSSLDRVQKNAKLELHDPIKSFNKLSLLTMFNSINLIQKSSYTTNKVTSLHPERYEKKPEKSSRNNFLDEDKPVSILSLNKILSKNSSFGILTHPINTRYDNYSLAFFKTIDSTFRNSNDYYYNSNHLKQMKVKVIDIFNKQSFYKKFSYSSKDFKKSDLDNTFAMNLHITRNMLKVYCNVFRINFVYKTIESGFQFLTRFDKNNATLILLEDKNALYTVYNKSSTFIRGSELSDVLEINKKYTESTLNKMKLDELQNIAKKNDKDVKKQGKTSKINKTKEEIISELIN
jgi:hypothetical protein